MVVVQELVQMNADHVHGRVIGLLAEALDDIFVNAVLDGPDQVEHVRLVVLHEALVEALSRLEVLIVRSLRLNLRRLMPLHRNLSNLSHRELILGQFIDVELQREKIAMELQLLNDGVFDEFLTDAYLRFLGNSRNEEHKAVLNELNLARRGAVVRVQFLLNFFTNRLRDHLQYFLVCWAFSEASDLVTVLFDEVVLRRNVRVRLMLQIERLYKLEEALRIKGQQPLEEHGIGDEAHDVEDVHAPLER